MKKILSLLLIIALCFTLTPSTASAAVTISKAKATMEVDSTLILKVSGTSSKAVWKTSSKSIATVSTSGKVTATQEGTATITATISNKKYTCSVTVVDSNKITTTEESTQNYKNYDGTYEIGVDLPEGEYVIFSTITNGYFSLSTDSKEKNIIVNDSFEYNTIIYAKDGEFLRLLSSRAVPLDSAIVDTSESGTFKIGTHLSAGEYRITSRSIYPSVYYIYNDNRRSDIESYDKFEGEVYVTVRDGQYLELFNCNIEK